MSDIPDPLYVGLDPGAVDEWVDLIERDPITRQLAEIAHRIGKPFAVVEATFDRSALAVEQALQVVKAKENARRCSQCGTSPDEFEVNGRPVGKPMWETELWHCGNCEANEEDVNRLPENVQKYTRIQTKPAPR